MNRSAATLASMISISVALAGCAHLQVARAPTTPTGISRFNSAPQADQISYTLPKTSIAVVATLTLNDCDNIVAGRSIAKSVDLPLDSPPINVTENFVIAPVVSADAGQEYRIRIDKTRSWSKQLNLAIARNPNSTLVSFNGTLADQAGPAIVAAIGTAVAIGGAVAMPALAPAAAIGAKEFVTNVGRANDLDKGTKDYLIDLTRKNSEKGFINEANLRAAIDKSGIVSDVQKPRIEKIYQKSVADTAKRIPPVKIGTRPKDEMFCSTRVRTALTRIAEQQTIVNEALAKSSARKTAGAPTDDKSTSPTVDPVVTRAQAQIARISVENGLSKSVRWVWTPSAHDLPNTVADDSAPITLEREADFFGSFLVPAWFSDAGAVDRIEARAAGAPAAGGRAAIPADPSFQRLVSALMLRLEVQPWTIGRDFNDKPDGTGKEDPTGIVYRDPATSTLRVCLGPCTNRAGGVLPGASSPNTTAEVVDTFVTDTSNDLINTPVPLTQFGRLNVQTMHSALFGTAVASFTQGGDGTISQIGTQSSNSAAAGLASATAVANAASTAIAARNTAITAQNGAAVATAQFADTVNKALADCLAQQALISAQGMRPLASCQ